MPHECADCGEHFEALSALRLHDCPDDESAEDADFDADNWLSDRGDKRRRERESLAAETVSETFTELLETTQNGGDETAAVSLLANYLIQRESPPFP